MEVKCVFYCEFNITTGPELIAQVPDDYLKSDRFKKLSYYLIPNSELCGKLTTLRLSPHELYFGLPVEIENKNKYERGSFEFNLGLLLSDLEYNNPQARAVYEAILRKTATQLAVLENESEYLSSPEKKAQLRGVMGELFKILKTYPTENWTMSQITFCLQFDEFNVLSIKLKQLRDAPSKSFDLHEVPSFRFVKEEERERTQERLAKVGMNSHILLRKIVPYIDGKRHVQMISKESQVSRDLVNLCLEHLQLYKVIRKMDIF